MCAGEPRAFRRSPPRAMINPRPSRSTSLAQGVTLPVVAGNMVAPLGSVKRTTLWGSVSSQAAAAAVGLGWGTCGGSKEGCGEGAVTHGIAFADVADARFHHSGGTALKRHQCPACKADFRISHDGRGGPCLTRAEKKSALQKLGVLSEGGSLNSAAVTRVEQELQQQATGGATPEKRAAATADLAQLIKLVGERESKHDARAGKAGPAGAVKPCAAVNDFCVPRVHGGASDARRVLSEAKEAGL